LKSEYLVLVYFHCRIASHHPFTPPVKNFLTKDRETAISCTGDSDDDESTDTPIEGKPEDEEHPAPQNNNKENDAQSDMEKYVAHQQGLGIVRDEKQEKTLVSELGRETIFKCAKFFGNDMKSRYSPFAKLVQKRLGVSDAYMDKHWNEWILKLLTSSVGTRRSTVTTAMRKEAIGKFFPCFFFKYM
jgi:hypothetical protein